MTKKGATPKSRYRPRSKSKLIDTFVLFCRAHGLPAPLREVKFHHERKWRFDYAWIPPFEAPGNCVALEVEGGAFTNGRHTRGAGFVADMAKYNAAALAGWTVLRYTPQQLTSDQTIQDLKQALGVTG